LTGTPTAPTAASTDNSTTLATTAFVKTAVGSGGGGAQVYISDTAPASPTAGSLWWESDTGALYIYYTDANGSQWVLAAPPSGSITNAVRFDTAQSLTTTQQQQARSNIGAAATAAVVMRAYLAGLTLATVGSSATFTVAPGVAADSTNVDMMALAASLSKTTAAWGVGAAGALDTGAITASTWYHAHLIKRTDTQVVDALISLSATAPALPSGYTEFRRIGAMKTNASSQWIAFTQNGDEFLWAVPVQDMNAGTISTTAALISLSVATGVQVWSLGSFFGSSSSALQILITSPDQVDTTPSLTAFDIALNSGQSCTSDLRRRRTNTSGQLRFRASAAGANTYIMTHGWIDRRGRDS
jgi:hypothetical protein